MTYLSIVTSLMLIQLFLFSLKVGSARGKYGINAPKITGNDEFERIYRVHQNTMEQLFITLPSMWIFAQFFNPMIAAALGVVFIIGRFVYSHFYIQDPKSRGKGFLIGFLATAVLMLGSLVGGIWEVLKQNQII